MKSVLVLGGTGMLGSMLTDELARSPGLRLSATYRSAGNTPDPTRLPGVQWHAFDAAAAKLQDQLAACGENTWIINAIGITKPLIRDDAPRQIETAIRINALLPHAIAAFARTSGARVLQIATDCVYSGAKGSYLETDLHDALDVYGKTKSLGECYEPGVHHLRCSIIGPEPKDFKFLIEWFRSQPATARVNGYLNHQWNGVTTLQFARICRGIIESEPALPHLQHVVPQGAISKAQMLHEFVTCYRRSDITVSDVNAASVVDRTLATCRADLNSQLWKAAGYANAPTVPEMISEVAQYDYRFVA
jgi:dTDP-4-dehydrorhamnose reductase